MNKAKSEYNINGWWIVASELYNDWDCFPIGMNDEQHDDFNNNECKTFKRLSEVKTWIKTNEADLLKEKYTTDIKITKVKEIIKMKRNVIGKNINEIVSNLTTNQIRIITDCMEVDPTNLESELKKVYQNEKMTFVALIQFITDILLDATR